MHTLQELETRNPRENPESRQQILSNFDWTDSMLQQDEMTRIEDLLLEYMTSLPDIASILARITKSKWNYCQKKIPMPTVKIYRCRSISKRTSS